MEEASARYLGLILDRDPAGRLLRDPVLADLVSAYLSGVATIDLIASHGTCATSRLHGLGTVDGYDVATCEVGGKPGYGSRASSGAG